MNQSTTENIHAKTSQWVSAVAKVQRLTSPSPAEVPAGAWDFRVSCSRPSFHLKLLRHTELLVLC